MLEAEEGREGKQVHFPFEEKFKFANAVIVTYVDLSFSKQGMEKLLLERLLARKELRLTAMQEKVKMQSIK